MSDPQTLTNERKNQHGDWMAQAEKGFELKESMRASKNWNSLKPYQREALDMITVKISRILSGDPNHADHWDDIAGYAFLGKGGHAPEPVDYQKMAQDLARDRAAKS